MRIQQRSLLIVWLLTMAAVGLWVAVPNAHAQSDASIVEDLPPSVAADDGAGVEQPAEQPAEQPVEQPAEQPVEQPAEQPAEMSNAGNVETFDGVIANLPLDEAPIRTVLRQLARLSRKNIIPSKGVTGNVSAELYDVTVREALDAILRVNGFDYIEQGNFIYVYTAKEIEDIRQAERPLLVRVFRLYYVKPEDAKTFITPCMSKDGSIAITPNAKNGIGTSESDAGGMDYATDDVLVVRDYQENLDEIARVLQNVDKRPQQVLIEATILRATLTEDTALGIDFNTLSGINFSGIGATTNGLTDLSTGSVSASALNRSQGTMRTDFNELVPSGGFSFGWIGSNAAMFIRALEGVTDTVVLANPKLLVVNKMRGEVLVGRKDGYLTTILTETTATQAVQFLETGTHLLVRPYIGDNGYIRLEIHPEDSSGSVADGLPRETTTECTSNVMVRDGHTIIISGLFREITTSTRNQVPLLGNIPFAGAAFRSTDDRTEREEVIILITPRIIKQAPDELASEQLLDDVQHFRLGARQQLAWFGRSRMAATYLRWAKEHMANGNTKWALWDINMTLNLSPRMHEAMLLKENLTNEAIWAREPRISSVKWIIQKMVMNELGLDPDMVTVPRKPLDANELPESVRDAMGIGNLPAPTQNDLMWPWTLNVPQVKVDANPADVTGSETAVAVESLLDATSCMMDSAEPAETTEGQVVDTPETDSAECDVDLSADQPAEEPTAELSDQELVVGLEEDFTADLTGDDAQAELVEEQPADMGAQDADEPTDSASGEDQTPEVSEQVAQDID